MPPKLKKSKQKPRSKHTLQKVQDSPKIKQKPRDYRDADIYYTEGNAGSGFAVYVGRNSVCVYRQGARALNEKELKNKNELWKMFSLFVCEFKNVTQVFIGFSSFENGGDYLGPCKDCKFDKCNCPQAIGTTLLIHLGYKSQVGYTYVYMDERVIYQFTFHEPILQYDSPMGPNYVPYPSARSVHCYLFLLDQTWYDKCEFGKAVAEYDEHHEPDDNRRTPTSLTQDLHLYYYEIYKKFPPHPFENVKIIYKRI
jgi:hypothetical protein